MKKVRILFLLCLVAVLAIGMALSVSAAQETNGIVYVNAICIEMDAPWDGEEIPVDPIPQAEYTITACSLYGGVHTALPEAIAAHELEWLHIGSFCGGADYYLNLTVGLLDMGTAADVHYNFSETVYVYLNGELMTGVVPSSDTLLQNGELHIQARALTYINASVPSLPVAVAGTAIAPYSYAAADGSYTVTGTWKVYNYETKALEDATGNFADGKLYQLVLNTAAAEGYCFVDWDLMVENEDYWYNPDYEGSSNKSCTYYISIPCGEIDWVYRVKISGQPESITAGAAISAPTITPVNDNVNITAQWVDENYEPATGTFQAGKVYYLQLTVTPKEGYMLESGISVRDENNDYLGYSETNGVKGVVNLRYSLLPTVDKVEISGVVDAVIGQAPTTEGIKAPDGANYTVEYKEWHNPTSEGEWTAFADGNKYYLNIEIMAKEGYEFADDVVVTVNGKTLEMDSDYGCGYENVSIYLEYSFLDQIDKVDITVPTPEIGQTATLDNIVLPEGIELDENQSYWYEYVTIVENGENYGVQKPVEGAFQKGHKYYLELQFCVKSGYEFTDEAELYLNGTAVEGYNDTYGHLWSSGGYLHTGYSFMDVIDKVEITGVTAPVVGQTATTEGITITGADASELEVCWREEDTGEIFTGVFETGKAYYLDIEFEPAEGAEFAVGCTVTVNGEEPDSGYAYGESGYAYVRYSFKTVIDKVEITGLPQFTVGGTASVESLKAPEGANYEIVAMWNDPTGDDSESFTGTFAADGIYVLYVAAEPKDGYEFAENAQFLIDGKVPETEMTYIYEDYVIAVYYYAPALEEFGKVELTVKEPVIGGKIEDYTPKAPEGAKYELDAWWYVSDNGKTWTSVDSGTFQEGKCYRLSLHINLIDMEENEIWFGNQPQASLNGVDIVWDGDENYAGPSYMAITYETGKLCSHTYGDWTSVDSKCHGKTCSKCGHVATEEHAWHSEDDVKCPACGYVRSDNPPTGDAIIPACLLALCSVTALVVIKRRSVR